ncbi:MAG: hypothetical protein J6D29_01225 [Solobacterium sp.]|nr:hypothetical protein [Solobacterium sp.]
MIQVIEFLQRFEERYREKIEVLYYVLFGLIFTYSFYLTTLFDIPILYRTLTLLAYGATALLVPVCLLSIVATKNKKVAIIKLLIVALAVFQQLYLSRFKMSAIELLVVGASDKSFTKILKIYLYIGIVMMIAAFIGSVTGFLPDFVDGHRHNYGIVYSLDCAAHYLYLLIAAHMLYFKKYKWVMFVVTCIFSLIVWFLIEAKTSMVLFLIFSIFTLYFVLDPKQRILKNKPTEWFLIGSFIIFFIIITVLTLSYTPEFYQIPFFAKWRTLTWRLQLGKRALTEYPIRLFGQQIYENINHESPKDYFLIDCSYIRCLLMYGLTHFIFLMSAHTIIQKKLIQQKFHIFAFMLMLIAIHSTMEILLLDIAYNVFILMLFAKIDIPSLE